MDKMHRFLPAGLQSKMYETKGEEIWRKSKNFVLAEQESKRVKAYSIIKPTIGKEYKESNKTPRRSCKREETSF